MNQRGSITLSANYPGDPFGFRSIQQKFPPKMGEKTSTAFLCARGGERAYHALVYNRDEFLAPCMVSDKWVFTESEEAPNELFTAALILDLFADSVMLGTHQARLAETVELSLTEQGQVHFFADRSLLPADVDCTSIGVAALNRAGRLRDEYLHTAIDAVVNNRTEDGVIHVYFVENDRRYGILDPVVCMNALFLVALGGRSEEVVETRNFLFDVFEHGWCKNGTRYYPSQDAVLYFLARLVHYFPEEYEAFRPILYAHIKERLGQIGSPMQIAHRTIAAIWLGMSVEDEIRQLVAMQNLNGMWTADAFFRFGRKEKYFGSEVLTTAFALKALCLYNGRTCSQELEAASILQVIGQDPSPTGCLSRPPSPNLNPTFKAKTLAANQCTSYPNAGDIPIDEMRSGLGAI